MNETDRQLIEKITKEIYSGNSGAKEELQRCLSGEMTESSSAGAPLKGLYEYSFSRHPYGFEDGYAGNRRQRQLVDEMFRILYDRAPDFLLNFLQNVPDRFFYYKNAGIPVEFMLKDVELIFIRMQSHSEPYIKWTNSVFKSIEKTVPELFGEIAGWGESKNEYRIAAHLYLMGYQKNVKQLESCFIPFVDRTIEAAGSGRSPSVLLTLFMVVQGRSKNLDREIRERLSILPVKFERISLTGAISQWYLQVCHMFQAPVSAEIRLWLKILTTVQGKTRIAASSLRELARLHYRDFRETFENLLEEKETISLTAYAVLLNAPQFQKEEAEHLNGYRNAVTEVLLSKVQSIYQSQPERFHFESGREGDFSGLRSENIEQLGFSVNLPSILAERWSWFSLLTASCFLVEELDSARNILVLIGDGLTESARLWITILENCYIFHRTEENLAQMLYRRGIPLRLICLLFIDYQGGARYSGEAALEGRDLSSELSTLLKEHQEEAEEGIRGFQMSDQEYSTYLKFLYETDLGFSDEKLADALEGRSKRVLAVAEELLASREEGARARVEELLNSKNKTTSDTACRLIRKWDNEKYGSRMKRLEDIDELTEYVEKLYTKNNERMVPYGKVIHYDQVRAKDSDEYLPEKLMKYYVSEYILLKELYFLNACAQIQERANLYDVRNLIREIYEMWLSEGSGAKYKNILLPYALTAGAAQLDVLKKQVSDWAENGKPGIAELAVKCMALNGSRMALLLVDTMAQKHKNKRVRKAAAAALEFAMEQLAISREEFEDMMVPDLGFDRNRTRMFCYGEREFKAVLGTDLSVALYDGDRSIRSLPKASEKHGDKEELAAAAKEELKAVKKQCKTILDNQKQRLERAVYTQRLWKRDDWERLFIHNPLMLCFAAGLVWGELDQDGNLMGTFRYLEDGTFNSAEEDEYELHENSRIALVHPADLSQEEVDAWNSQLEDYEVKQPVEQMRLPICRLEKRDRNKTELKEASGLKVYGGTIKSVASKLGGDLMFGEYGSCQGISYGFPELDLRLIIQVDSSFYPGEYNTVVQVTQMYFCKDEGLVHVPLHQIPARLLGFAGKAAQLLNDKNIVEEGNAGGK